MSEDERVQCVRCQEWFWKSDCTYFDLGEIEEFGRVDGYKCKACEQHTKEALDGLNKHVHEMIERYKNSPPQPEKPITFEV